MPARADEYSPIPPAAHPARRLRTVLALAALVLAPLAAIGQSGDRDLGIYENWHTVRFSDENGPVCMMWSQPEKSEGDYTRRGDVFVFVSHRPGEDAMNKVNFQTGYTFEEASEVEVRIDAHEFVLATGGSTAWTYASEDDAKLVEAMRAGQTMVVEGTSNRGTLTRDTYSLLGFTAAHQAIGKACRAN